MMRQLDTTKPRGIDHLCTGMLALVMFLALGCAGARIIGASVSAWRAKQPGMTQQYDSLAKRIRQLTVIHLQRSVTPNISEHRVASEEVVPPSDGSFQISLNTDGMRKLEYCRGAGIPCWIGITGSDETGRNSHCMWAWIGSNVQLHLNHDSTVIDMDECRGTTHNYALRVIFDSSGPSYSKQTRDCWAVGNGGESPTSACRSAFRFSGLDTTTITEAHLFFYIDQPTNLRNYSRGATVHLVVFACDDLDSMTAKDLYHALGTERFLPPNQP
ncbi:MAG: hypothetical protein ACYC7E_16255 [Armatimonadota bacterium]